MKSMKALILLTLLFPTGPAWAASSGVEAEGKALEAEMNKTPADIKNMTWGQQKLVDKASAYVGRALRAKNLSTDDLTEVSRIIVRNFAYDQENALAEDNFDAIERYGTRIEKIFELFEKTGAFDAKTLEAVRATIGIGGRQRHPDKVDSKSRMKSEDGAQLSPCDLGRCNPPSTLSTAASRGLRRLSVNRI